MTKKEIIEQNQEALRDNPELERMSGEVMEHMINPKNYGKLAHPNGVGQAVSPKSNEFANVYIDVEKGIINDISFGCRSCQDTTVSGSIFTTMVKGTSVDEALSIMKDMDKQIEIAPPKQKIASQMILRAFESAIQNMENRKTMLDQEMVSVEV